MRSETDRAAGDHEARAPRSRGKLVAFLSLVLAVVVLAATAWLFRGEISRFCLRTYWRWKQVPGTVGITVAEESGSAMLRIVEVTRRSSNVVLRKGDLILRVAGEDVNTLDGMVRVAGQRRAGEVLPFVVRRGEETLELEVMLEPREGRREVRSPPAVR